VSCLWRADITVINRRNANSDIGSDDSGNKTTSPNTVQTTAYCRVDSMEILLSQRSVNQLWDARDRALFRAPERVVLTGPSAKEAELWA
jgi:hypothetical protein